ncbi:PKD domain-containing protein [Crocinitomix catalasitica]|uniref:PKD domain-containing protein n=1 Tax=Crocinitomix catalasitica TaxID=184607 RepID=UPI0012FC4C36|nr:PKD domain-containing protein [Crocinitomix catalasitica]
MKLNTLYLFCLLGPFVFIQNSYSQIEFLVTLDRTVGEHTIINNLPTVNYIYLDATAYDQNSKRYIFRGIDFSGDFRLYCIDANTGVILSSPVIDIAIGQFQYDHSTDMLYGLKISGGVMYIVSLDIPTATISEVVELPIVGYSLGSSFFDEANQNFVILNSGTFYAANVETGEIVVTPASGRFSEFQYDDTNGNLYSLLNGVTTDLVQIDVAGESHRIIATMPESGFRSGITSFDEINQYFTYASLSYLYTIDVLTGDILWDPVFPNVEPGENVIECHYDNETGVLYALHWGAEPEEIEPPEPAYVLNDTICNGEIATLTLVGPGDYNWTTTEDPGTILGTDSIFNVSPFVSTDYFALNDEDTILVSVIVIETNANFIVRDTIGCSALTVNYYDVSSNSIGDIVSWNWTFSDGETSILQHPTRTYYESFEGETTLEIITDYGCHSTITYASNITIVPRPIAAFSYTPEDPTTEDELSFIDESVFAETWEWSFGDGDDSSLENPFHFYRENGTFEVMLKVSNEYCSDSIIIPIIMKVFILDEDSADDLILNEETEDEILTDVIERIEVDTIELVLEVIDSIVIDPEMVIPTTELLFYIPNAFTPNSGMLNNEFTPIFTSGYNPYDYHFTVFNRLGEIVFESYDAKIGWDGTYGYENVSTGVYVWQIEFQLDNSAQKEVHRGHITLLR